MDAAGWLAGSLIAPVSRPATAPADANTHTTSTPMPKPRHGDRRGPPLPSLATRVGSALTGALLMGAVVIDALSNNASKPVGGSFATRDMAVGAGSRGGPTGGRPCIGGGGP